MKTAESLYRRLDDGAYLQSQRRGSGGEVVAKVVGHRTDEGDGKVFMLWILHDVATEEGEELTLDELLDVGVVGMEGNESGEV